MKRETKLSKHSVGPGQPWTPDPDFSTGLTMIMEGIRSGSAVIWRHLCRKAMAFFWELIFPGSLIMTGICFFLVACHYAGAVADWIINLIVSPLLRLFL